ncbi:MAG: hypothetical protein QXO32_08240 [Candidatus Bathyarchaeia archaeon]
MEFKIANPKGFRDRLNRSAQDLFDDLTNQLRINASFTGAACLPVKPRRYY